VGLRGFSIIKVYNINSTKTDMELRFRPINLKAGRPVAFVNLLFAKKMNIHEGGRIEVSYRTKKAIIIANIMENFVKEGEISFSDEAAFYFNLKKGDKVRVNIPLESLSTQLILKKLNRKELKDEEVHIIVKDIVNNALSETEIAYFISAVYEHGMTMRETISLTKAIATTGKIMKWKERVVADKHSIGGIPGNRTTPIVVSICAAAGVLIPKTSSRAITSSAGTADTVETIANVNLSYSELIKAVEKTGACLAWGGSLGLAPADDKLIRVERLLNLDPEPQLIASIMAKKISVGSKYVLIDIPCGRGAKVSRERAIKLKEKFVRVGKYFGIKTDIVLTEGNEPIGNGIGPVLEMLDVLRVLKREDPPIDLEKKSIFLSSWILERTGKAEKGNGVKIAQEILNSGKAFKKFDEIITAQGRKRNDLKLGKFKYDLKSSLSGTVRKIDNKLINLLGRVLGCPADKSAGIYLHKHVGDNIKKEEKILTIYAESRNRLNEGLKFFMGGGVIIVK